jgi:TRAP transporter TAXI family solute receptor
MVLLAVVAVLLTGCAAGKQSFSGQETSARQTVDVVISHGAIGGTWNTVAEGIGEVLRETYPGSKVSVIPGSGEGNLARLQKGEVELALSTTDNANSALKGLEAFKAPVPPEEIQGIAGLYSAHVQFFILTRTGILAIEEIKEKKYPLRISVHTRGSGVEVTARRVLGAYGITYEDIEAWGGRVVFVGASDAAQMMADGQLDAYLAFDAVPLTNMTELSLRRDFTVLSLHDEVIEKLRREFNYVVSAVPKGSYKGVERDLPSLSTLTCLYASGSLDEETAYLVTKALLQSLARLELVHVRLKGLTPEYMSQNLNFPLHPGAKKAYGEY